MSCYLQTLGWLFRMLEIEKSAGNRHLVDLAVRRALQVEPGAPCSEVRAHLDQLSVEERFAMIDSVQRELRV